MDMHMYLYAWYVGPPRSAIAMVQVQYHTDRTGSPGAVLIVRFARLHVVGYASFAGGMGDRALVRRRCVPGTDVTSAPLSVRSAPFALPVRSFCLEVGIYLPRIHPTPPHLPPYGIARSP